MHSQAHKLEVWCHCLLVTWRTLSLVKHYISMFLEQTSLCKCGCWCVDVCVSALNLQNIGQWPVQCPCPRKKLISASFYVSPFNQCFCPFAPAQKSTCRFLSMYCVSMCVCLDVLARADKERLAECCFLSAHQRQHCFNLIAIIHWKTLTTWETDRRGKKKQREIQKMFDSIQLYKSSVLLNVCLHSEVATECVHACICLSLLPYFIFFTLIWEEPVWIAGLSGKTESWDVKQEAD